MSIRTRLLHVAFPSARNMQQKGFFKDFNATSYATIVQRAALKALNTNALLCNRACNKCATLTFFRMQQKFIKKYVFVASKRQLFKEEFVRYNTISLMVYFY